MEETPSRKWWRNAVIIAAIIGALGAIIAQIIPSILNDAGSIPIRVPDVRGTTLDAAERLLQQSELERGKVKKKITDESPHDTVVSQDPAPHTEVPPRTPVHLIIASKVEVPVPDVRGMTLDAAERLLQQSELERGKVKKKITDESPHDTVVSQDPAPHTEVPPGTPVHLIIASKVEVPVPDVRGMTLDAAERSLRKSKFEKGEVKEQSRDKGPFSIVISQDPAPHTEVPPGTSVHLTIAKPEPEDRVVVPDVRGSTIKGSRELIQRSGLVMGTVLTEYRENVPPGTVVAQNPSPGTLTRYQTPVNLVVAERAVKVPDVIRRSQKEAKRLLNQSDLNVGKIQKKLMGAVKLDMVVDQDPAPNTLVPIGTTVDLYIENGVPVPDILGSTLDKAKALISEYELQVGKIERKSIGDGHPGTVIKQNPSSDTIVSYKSHVDIVVKIPVVVPNLYGDTEDQAENRLREVGLQVREVSKKITGRGPVHTIVDQDPIPQTPVAHGSFVALVVEAPSMEVVKLAGGGGPLDDPRVQAALLCAWQWKELWETRFFDKPKIPIFTKQPGSTDEDEQDIRDIGCDDPNPKRRGDRIYNAKFFLQEAGYPNSFEGLVIHVPKDFVSLAQWMQAKLHEIAIRSVIRVEKQQRAEAGWEKLGKNIFPHLWLWVERIPKSVE